MLDEEDEDGDIEVRFLWKTHKTDNAYVDPVVEDIHAVPVTSVKVVLHRPVDEQCPTKGTTGIKRFPVNLEYYHIIGKNRCDDKLIHSLQVAWDN